MNIRQLYGYELKKYVLAKSPTEKIGMWAFSFYWENIDDVDLDFRELLLTLNKMELGPEFAFTYEELNQIADDLIAGKNVDLNSEEYRETDF